jgi:FlaA1/EpsC-like NDP-sugar epimerase
MEKVVIFGTGVIGQLAHFYFSHDSDFKVVAFTADDEYVESDELLGLPVVKFSDVARLFPPEQYSMFVQGQTGTML